MPDLVLPLRALGRGDVLRAGGKAANLGEMIRAGLPVPDGFCVTCDAYRAHLEVHGLDGRIAERLRAVDEASLGALEAAAAEARAWIAGAALPSRIAEVIASAYAAMGGEAVAVRSSATAEDLADASFAGQHDTVLDVAGEAAVLEAVRVCWASLFTERAVRYRRRHGHDREPVAIACVVQRMVAARTAGVAFTADPLTGERDRVVVNAVAGLGEALVSGHATADQFVLAKKDGAVLARTVRGPAGASGAEPFLGDVLSLALGVESHYGEPQDIEWAVEATQHPGTPGPRTFLLQARPITRLPPEPVSLAGARRPLLAHPTRVREQYPCALTPLGGDYVDLVFLSGIREGSVRLGLFPRRWVDAVPLWRVVRGRVRIDAGRIRDLMLPFVEEVAFLRLLESGEPPRLADLRPSLRSLPLVLRTPLVLWVALRYLHRLERHFAECARAMEALLDSLEREDHRGATRERLVALLRGCPSESYAEHHAMVMVANGFAGADSEMYYRLLEHISSAWAGEPTGSAAKLVSGLPGIAEVECTKDLWNLALAARESPEMARVLVERRPSGAVADLAQVAGGPEWLAGLERFLARHGHRGVEELDLARPRWREDPALPLAVVANYIAADAASGPDAGERRLAAEREAVSARIATRLGPLRRWLFRQVLAITQKLSVARQNSKSIAMRASALSRRAALELGRRLADEGRVASADDVFFLRFGELETAGGAGGRDLRALVAERRREHSAWERETPPALIDADGRAVREASLAGRSPRAGQARGPEPADDLAGIGSSPGTARGRVRVVRDASRGVRIEPGEVLVAPYTDPAWTPLFLSAGAVVVEIGSLLSHASIVARELGIPSVVAVAGATRALHDGEWVEVDGTAGSVRRIPAGR